MRILMLIIPFIMALINVPFFPSPINIVAAIICIGIGFIGLAKYEP